jgi:hypothetical protein
MQAGQSGGPAIHDYDEEVTDKWKVLGISSSAQLRSSIHMELPPRC